VYQFPSVRERSAFTSTEVVYGQAMEPGDWHDGRLLTMSEVRHIHHLAMTPVWDVAPHPDATDREGPGSFVSMTFTLSPEA
jgi:hypothetical protein